MLCGFSLFFRCFYDKRLNIKQYAALRDPFYFPQPVVSKVTGSVPEPVRRFIANILRAAILALWVLLGNVPVIG
jgi:hypothetical protein